MKTLLLTAVLFLSACGSSAPKPAPPQQPAAETTTTKTAAEGAAVAAASTSVAPADAAHGKAIVGSKCSSCHGTEVFTRADHKVKSMDALHAQVDSCGSAANLSASDKKDVASYLNGEYYHFE